MIEMDADAILFNERGQRLDDYRKRISELETTLRHYANPGNWTCNRCKGKDHLNCAMTRWVGRVGMEGHGFEIAQEVMK